MKEVTDPAFPTTTNLAHDERRPLNIRLSTDAHSQQ